MAERANGRTAAEEVTREQAEQLTETLDPELPDERARRFTAPGFAHVKIDFSSDAQQFLAAVHQTIDTRMQAEFGDAFAILHELHTLIREPGEGAERWRREPDGRFVEHWEKLTLSQMERFLFLLTTHLVIWEQKAEEAWAEAMCAKVNWEQAFSQGYEQLPDGGKDTIEGRTSRGKILAKDDHYLAIFRTYYSRKAQRLTTSMERLSQRLKDVYQANKGR